MSQCILHKPWVGRCEDKAIDGGKTCAEHTQKCHSCGESATHGCEETGMFVCGEPLCNDCEHSTFPDGTNGGVRFNQQRCPAEMRHHCRKTEQKYLPWYAREKE
jgi:hypothetical protein